MIVAIMQPYFFPYIGYFQLMNSVDLFIFYDDVQYMKNGWINRNRIAIRDKPKWVTLPVARAGLQTDINERHYILETKNINSLKRRVQAVYKDSPYFDIAFELFSEILDFEDRNVARFNASLLSRVGGVLDIRCEYAMSSTIGVSSKIKGQERVIALCKSVAATHYVNPIGGFSLYQHAAFTREGIELSFLETRAPPPFFNQDPQHLSILDGLMRLGPVGCKQLLPEYVIKHDEGSSTAP